MLNYVLYVQQPIQESFRTGVSSVFSHGHALVLWTRTRSWVCWSSSHVEIWRRFQLVCRCVRVLCFYAVDIPLWRYLCVRCAQVFRNPKILSLISVGRKSWANLEMALSDGYSFFKWYTSSRTRPRNSFQYE